MKTLQLWPILSLEPSEGELVAFDIGPDRAVYLLHALKPLDYRREDKGASFAKVRPATPQRYRAQAWLDGAQLLDLCINDEPYNVHALQPLGDDLLLVCARSTSRGGDSDLNGRVYSRDGRLLDEIALGDAIEHVQTTARGEIWLGYFDEGVFGDHPLSAHGLVACGRQGTPLFRYQPDAPLDTIADCYALNVASHNEAWTCYYTDFPLVQLRDHRIVRHWNVPVYGAHAFAVYRDRALFAGGYDARHACTLLRLDDGPDASVMATFKLLDEHGEPLQAQLVRGRGDTLYLYRDDRVYACDIHQAISAFSS